MKQPIYIIVNPHCHEGRGWKRWQSIRNEVFNRFPSATEIITENAQELEQHISEMPVTDDDTLIISAGGDGSIHQLANTVLKPGLKNQFTIGGIGLGSSNDFLKPFWSFIANIPVRVNTSIPPILHDAGKIKYVDRDNFHRDKYFVCNASFGATAEGNWNFNHPNRLLKCLKKTNTGAAIAYAAIFTILGYKNKYAYFRFNGTETQAAISNINLLKIPYVSGNLHYKQAIMPGDGTLGLNICINMRRIELLRTFLQLEKGKFTENNKRISVITDSFLLKSQVPIVFECDGETAISPQVEISVIHQALKVLAP